jgi:hypothetical protein
MTAQSRTWTIDAYKRAKKQTAYARKSRRMAHRTLEPVQVVKYASLAPENV